MKNKLKIYMLPHNIKHVSRAIASVAFLFFILGCSNQGGGSFLIGKCTFVIGEGSISSTPVSFVELLAGGSAYDDVIVRVSGSLFYDKNDGFYLFLSEDSLRASDYSSSIYVHFNNPDHAREIQKIRSGSMVTLEGVYIHIPRIIVEEGGILTGAPKAGVIDDVLGLYWNDWCGLLFF